MKVDLGLKCQNQKCGQPWPFKMDLKDPSMNWICAKCGSGNALVPSLDTTSGMLALHRGQQEFWAEDDTMPVILSAWAIEADLSRYATKWLAIDGNLVPSQQTEIDQLMKAFIPRMDVQRKIRKVVNLLTQNQQGLDAFVASDTDSATHAQQVFGVTIGLVKSVYSAVFKPRNQIVHAGFVGCSPETAWSSLRAADFLVMTLARMDKRRYQRWNADSCGNGASGEGVLS